MLNNAYFKLHIYEVKIIFKTHFLFLIFLFFLFHQITVEWRNYDISAIYKILLISPFAGLPPPWMWQASFSHLKRGKKEEFVTCFFCLSFSKVLPMRYERHKKYYISRLKHVSQDPPYAFFLWLRDKNG